MLIFIKIKPLRITILKIIHIITGLNNGGAEGFLFRLCKNDNQNRHIIISLTDNGRFGPMFEELQFQVFSLNMPRGRLSLNGLIKLVNLIKNNKPDIIQTWMYHSNLIGGLISKLLGCKRIFWNIRHTNFLPNKSKPLTIWVMKICGKLSNWIPKKIIYCSLMGKKVHEDLGYNINKSEVIHNGYDLNEFKADKDLGLLFRKDIDIKKNEYLIGMVGRYDPQKDHYNLINALDLVDSCGYEFKAILIGKDMDKNNSKISEYIKSKKLDKKILLLGQRFDIPKVMNGLDIHVLSSSFGEAFPNVLAEAMACGTPCVSTDVGESSLILGNTGWLVPSNNSKQLAAKIIEAIIEKNQKKEEWKKRKVKCREHILENFNINIITKQYQKTWKNLYN